MNRKSFLLSMFCSLAFLGMQHLCAQDSDNVLDNVFHHRGAEIEQTSLERRNLGAEVGQIVLYFKQKPAFTVEHIKKNSSDMDQFNFFFPVKKITADAQAILGKSKIFKTDAYSVSLFVVPGGIKAVVLFNPSKTNFFYAWFDSIGDKHKGWTFRFFDRKRLNEISNPNPPVLRTASSKGGIVIDCGHGGIDAGASHFNLKEKNITLDLGQQLATLLQKQGYSVFLTRQHDVTLPLDTRTSFANNALPDICVSLHVNAAGAHARGIETYYLDENLFCGATLYPITVTDDKAIHSLAHGRMRKSIKLAQSMQRNMVNGVKKKASHAVDRGVKAAVSQMLMGVTSPCVVVEAGFLSNEIEAGLLADAEYQRLLVEGMCKGINEYFQSNHHTI